MSVFLSNKINYCETIYISIHDVNFEYKLYRLSTKCQCYDVMIKKERRLLMVYFVSKSLSSIPIIQG